jgi:hypothetical protein
MTAGVVLGWDHVSKTANYKYNDKPWLGIKFGLTF